MQIRHQQRAVKSTLPSMRLGNHHAQSNQTLGRAMRLPAKRMRLERAAGSTRAEREEIKVGWIVVSKGSLKIVLGKL